MQQMLVCKSEIQNGARRRRFGRRARRLSSRFARDLRQLERVGCLPRFFDAAPEAARQICSYARARKKYFYQGGDWQKFD